jgi:hypothetical protein
MAIALLTNPSATPCEPGSPGTQIKSVSGELGFGLPFAFGESPESCVCRA